MIGVGVIGYGYWGPNLVRNFAEADGARIAAVADRRSERLNLVRRRYPAVAVTTDAFDLIHRSDVDAVIIATPVSTHYELAHAALSAGKHVLIEKPITSRAEDAARLIDLAAAGRLTLMVDHTFVYTGAVRTIRELMASGELGDVYYYDSVRINLGLFQHDVNVIWDLAVHDLSIMDYALRQQPVGVSATGVAHLRGEPEDVAYLTIFFDNSLIGHLHVNWLAPVKMRRTLVGGSRQMIVYDDLESSEKVKVYDKGVSHAEDAERVYEMLVSYRTGDMHAPKTDMTEALQVETKHFLHCVEARQRPITDGEAGLRIVKLLEAAAASMAQHGRPVPVVSGAFA